MTAMTNKAEDDIPLATETPRKRWHLPLVWVVPIVAALIGGWIAVKTILEQGPTIVITFKTAESLEAGQTKIKYKDVPIGVVRNVRLGKDRQSVEVVAEIDKEAAHLLAEDTRFWVVRARISGSQVSGLSTLLSGSYIGLDPGQSKTHAERFAGLETQPIITTDLPGKQFVLVAPELGSIDIGSPVMYRRIQVGSVTAYALQPDGEHVELKIFVHAPYDRYVNSQSRFWNASGIDFSLNTEGVNVRTEGLTSLLVGGIAFQTPLHEMGTETPAEADRRFQLHMKRDIALQRPVTEVTPLLLVFSDSVRGLEPGAPITFMGVPVGEVSAVGLQYDLPKNLFQTVVDVNFYPQRLWERVRGPRPETLEQRITLWQGLINKGMRAQLRSGSLLTGQLYVALDFFPKEKPVAVNWKKQPVELPTMRGELEDIQAKIHSIADKLERLPLDSIGKELNKTLAQTSKLMEKANSDVVPEVKATLQSVKSAVDNAEKAMLKEGSPLQEDTREAMRELGRAAQSLRALTDYLERHPEGLVWGKEEDGK
jgi:paraquat-inducible protein B